LDEEVRRISAESCKGSFVAKRAIAPAGGDEVLEWPRLGGRPAVPIAVD
jgi:hypothetical protein